MRDFPFSVKIHSGIEGPQIRINSSSSSSSSSTGLMIPLSPGPAAGFGLWSVRFPPALVRTAGGGTG